MQRVRRQEQMLRNAERHARHAHPHHRTHPHRLPTATPRVERRTEQEERQERNLVQAQDLSACLAACVNAHAGLHHRKCVNFNHEGGGDAPMQGAADVSAQHTEHPSLARDMAARRVGRGVEGLRQVLQAGRQILRAMPLRQQTIYSAIQGSDGTFAHLVRSLAATSLQTVWFGHRARVKLRTLRVCDFVVKDAAKLLKSLPDHALGVFREFLSGEQPVQQAGGAPGRPGWAARSGLRANGPSGSGAPTMPEATNEELVDAIISTASGLVRGAPRTVLGHLHAMLLHDPHAAGAFYRNLLVNGSATCIQKVFRGHRRRMAIAHARARGVSPQAACEEQDLRMLRPQLLIPLESLRLSVEEMSVENLAGAGLAGLLNILQQTLARWGALSRILSAEQKALVFGSLASGSGPIVAVVKNVSATSLQMAMRAHLARRRLRNVRRELLSRVGPALDPRPASCSAEIEADRHLFAAAANTDPEQLAVPRDALPPRVITRRAAMQERGAGALPGSYSGGGSPGASTRPELEELERHHRLSAAVARFVRQMKKVLGENQLHQRHLVSSNTQTPGPLAHNLRILSATALQAVVRGHQVRRRIGSRVQQFRSALDEVSELQSMQQAVEAQLSLARAIRLGRYLFAFQEERFGGTHTFYSAVCAGTGGLSDALRHACALALQCALRARRARRLYFDVAAAALSEQVAGTRSFKLPWLKHTQARLEGGALVDARDGPPPPPPPSRKSRAQERRERKAAARAAEPDAGASSRDLEAPAPVGEHDEREAARQQLRASRLAGDDDSPAEAAARIEESAQREEDDEESGARADSGDEMSTEDSSIDLSDGSSTATGSESDSPDDWSDFEAQDTTEYETPQVPRARGAAAAALGRADLQAHAALDDGAPAVEHREERLGQASPEESGAEAKPHGGALRRQEGAPPDAPDPATVGAPSASKHTSAQAPPPDGSAAAGQGASSRVSVRALARLWALTGTRARTGPRAARLGRVVGAGKLVWCPCLILCSRGCCSLVPLSCLAGFGACIYTLANHGVRHHSRDVRA